MLVHVLREDPEQIDADDVTLGFTARSRAKLYPGKELVEVHAKSLKRDENLLPRAMRSIHSPPKVDLGIPESIEIEEEIHALAARLREAAIDLGAKIVTVSETEPNRAKLLASSASEQLSHDFFTGTISINNEGSIDALSQVLKGESSVRSESLDQLALLGSLAIIRIGQPVTKTTLAKRLCEFQPQPVLVTSGTDAVGLATEVMVSSDSTQLSPVRRPNRTGTSTKVNHRRSPVAITSIK